MKKSILALVILALSASVSAQPKLTKDNIDEVLRAMTLEEKATLCVGYADGYMKDRVPGAAGRTRAIERFGIPQTILSDGPAGLRIRPFREGTDSTFFCTGFPSGTLLASSWDIWSVSSCTEAMGNEVAEYGVDVLLGPGMNIHRNPLCGRNFEYFSEDPVLSGNIAAAYVNGAQNNAVGVTLKHYACNNQETNRMENDAIVSERALREIYLKNFEIAIRKSEPWAVMSSYNKVNGEYTQQSKFLLTRALRDDFGFKGIVMTDWGCKEGTAKAVMAGNDLMEPGLQVEIDRIVAAVKDGSLPMADLDRNARRMLEYIVNTPTFKHIAYSGAPDLKAHAEVARSVAANSMVLLRNEGGTLPLKPCKVALYGVCSIDFIAGGNGSGTVHRPYVVNMVDALGSAGFTVDAGVTDFYRKHIDSVKAAWIAEGKYEEYSEWGANKIDEPEFPAGEIAANAISDDVAVVVLGRTAGEGSDRSAKDFEITETERRLLYNVNRYFHGNGKKMIVILNIGGVVETASWKLLSDAILLPWSPGQEGANAVADVLTGKVNPSGRLPMTFPVSLYDHLSSANFPIDQNEGSGKNVGYTNYEEDIWVGYRYFDKAGIEVSYPFGFGLSYTQFEYSKPRVKATEDGFKAYVTITNTGKVKGREVVQLYLSAPSGGLEKPVKELKAFKKTILSGPGTSQVIEFTVSAYEMASFNPQTRRWETPAGTYTVQFGASANDIRASARFKQSKPVSFAVAEF